MGNDRKQDPRTVFVRGVSFDVDNDALSEAFSAVGPVRHAFLVKQGTGARHKGFGFVQFALQEDADRAVEQLNNTELGGKTLLVESAVQRAPLEERKSKRKEKPTEVADGDEGEAAEAAPEAGGVHMPKKPRPAPAPPALLPEGKKGSEKHSLVRSVALGGLSAASMDAAVALAKELGKVQMAMPATPDVVQRYKLLQDGCTGDVVVLTYPTVKEAMDAVVALHGRKLPGSAGKKGKKAAAGAAAGGKLWARQVSGEGLHLKRWRVVVRNLPFKATDADVRAAFSPAGFIWEVTVPRGSDGQPRGFAFVGFTCRVHAERAIKLVNAKTVAGRPVAVDWALAKRDYTAAAAAAGEEAPPEPAKAVKSSAKAAAALSSDDGGAGEGAGRVKGHEGEGDEAVAELQPEAERGMLRSVIDDILGGSDSEGAEAVEVAEGSEHSEDDGSEEEEDEESGEEEEVGFSSGEDEEDASVSEDFASSDSEEEEQVEGKKAATAAAPAGDMFGRQAMSDRKEEQEAALQRLERQAQRVTAKVEPRSSEGEVTTVFVRNLALDISKDQLFTALRAFGPLKSCRLVINKATEKPKGTAFADFWSRAAAEAAAEACARARNKEGPGVMVAGRVVDVDLALDGTAVRTLAAEKAGSAVSTDKRHLYLSKEGDIPEGSEAFEALSTGDQNKRRRAAEERRTKLRSPNFLMSRTRLAVRNVPPTWDEKRLRALFIEAVKERATKAKPRVTQVKLLRDQPAGGTDPGRSKGVAFVEFEDHEHALCALRQLNNNPATWGKERRPIVEFAIDDVKALKKREAKLMRQRTKAAAPPAGEGEAEEAEAVEAEAAVGNGREQPRGPSSQAGATNGGDADRGPQSKRQQRKERRNMLLARSWKKQEESGEGGEGAAAATDAAGKRSERRRLQRQRQKSKEAKAAASAAARPPAAQPSTQARVAGRKRSADEQLDRLAEAAVGEVPAARRRKGGRDALDKLVDDYRSRVDGRKGVAKESAVVPRAASGKRWFS